MAESSSWTLIVQDEFFLSLVINGSNAGTIVKLEVPKDPDFEDEHVLLFLEASDGPLRLHLNDFDVTKSSFVGKITLGESSNTTDFIAKIRSLNNLDKPYTTAVRSLSAPFAECQASTSQQSENQAGDDEPTQYVPGSPLSGTDSEEFDLHPSSISSPQITSTPRAGKKLARKKDQNKTFNSSMGIAMFEAHKSNHKLIGDDLPKFGAAGWPPPFRTTVTAMRKLLNDNCGESSRWTSNNLRFQKAYFNRVFGLQETKSASGNIYLFYKVSSLSERCWQLANKVMDMIENGSLDPPRRKKIISSKHTVVQSTFRFLKGKDPIKDEKEILALLNDYSEGKFPDNSGGVPTRKKAKTEDNTQETSSFKIEDLSERLQSEKEKSSALVCENKEQMKTIARLNNELSHSKGEIMRLQSETDKLKDENRRLSKALHVEESNSKYLASCVKDKEEEVHRLTDKIKKAEKLQKDLTKETSKIPKDKNALQATKNTLNEKETPESRRLEYKNAHSREKKEIESLERELATEVNEGKEKPSTSAGESTAHSYDVSGEKKDESLVTEIDEETLAKFERRWREGYDLKGDKQYDEWREEKERNTKIYGNLELSLKDLVAVAYDKTFHLGHVTAFKQDTVEITFLKKSSGCSYRAVSKKPEKELILPLYIFAKPAVENEGKTIRLLDIDNLRSDFQTFKQKYFQ